MPLDDTRRKQLDDIVLNLAQQNAPQEDVETIVNDFKGKYETTQPEEGILDKVGGFVKSFGSAIASGVEADVAFIKNPKQFTEDVATGITAERKDRATQEASIKEEMSSAFTNSDFNKYAELNKKLDEVKGQRSAAEVFADIPQDIAIGAETFTDALKLVPSNIKSAYLQATKGAEGASVVNKDKSTEYINKVNEDTNRLVADTKAKYGDREIFGLPITFSDLAQLPQSVGFSGVSMGAGIAAGAATPSSYIPYVGTVAAWTAGTAASGKVAYEMSTYQITQQYLEAKNEEKLASTGVGLTQDEEVKLKDGFQKLAMEYGLWEAVPEAISNAAFLKILTVPLSKMIGTSMASAVAQKVGGLYGEELLTETITQMGQNNVEVKSGMSKEAPRDWLSPEDWSKSFKEIAPQTFLLTTLMAGAGQSIISSKNAYDKIRTMLSNELDKKGASDDEKKKILDTIPNPKGEMQKEDISVQLSQGKSPNQIALELSQSMSSSDALNLVNEAVARETAAGAPEVAKPAETPIIAPEVAPAPAQVEISGVEEATKSLKAIDDTILTKTPTDIQAEFDAAQTSIDTHLTELQKNVADIKARLDQAPVGSAQKKALKIELTKAQGVSKKAEESFNKAVTTHAENFRGFLGNYISTNFAETKLTEAQKSDVIDNIAIKITEPSAIEKVGGVALKEIVSEEIAVLNR
jgi:hypothetical protein